MSRQLKQRAELVGFGGGDDRESWRVPSRIRQRSNITDAVAEEVKAWQACPLEAVYPIVYLDAAAEDHQESRSLLNDEAVVKRLCLAIRDIEDIARGNAPAYRKVA